MQRRTAGRRASGAGERKEELMFDGDGVSVWESERVMGMDGVTGAQQCECT